jgi:type II secretory ATPase GspE/PulE/Tfp pilus assembly ATPase PilB-like protein
LQRVESKYNRLLRDKDLARLEEGRYSYKSNGCDKCSHTGMAEKRLPIVEIIKFSNELRDFFSEKRGLNETEAFLRKRGYRSLWDKGMDLVVEKKLSLDELCSVLTPDEEIGMASDTEGAGED